MAFQGYMDATYMFASNHSSNGEELKLKVLCTAEEQENISEGNSREERNKRILLQTMGELFHS